MFQFKLYGDNTHINSYVERFNLPLPKVGDKVEDAMSFADIVNHIKNVNDDHFLFDGSHLAKLWVAIVQDGKVIEILLQDDFAIMFNIRINGIYTSINNGGKLILE